MRMGCEVQVQMEHNNLNMKHTLPPHRQPPVIQASIQLRVPILSPLVPRPPFFLLLQQSGCFPCSCDTFDGVQTCLPETSRARTRKLVNLFALADDAGLRPEVILPSPTYGL